MRERLDELQDIDAQILAVDPHDIWAARYLLKETGQSTDDLQFPLLLDPSLTASATWGVAFQMRIHTEWSNRPATFIIDKAGIVQYAKRGRAFADRPSPDQIAEQLRKLQ